MPRGQRKASFLVRILPIFLFLYLFFPPFFVQAEFSLNVSPVDGSSSIRFPRIDTQPVNVEVRVSINSDQGKRYELRQKLLEDFRNDQGDILSRNAISFYTLSGSNSHGSLYQTTPAPLDTMDRVLYSSSGQAGSDSFVIVYQVNPSDVDVSGNFFSRIFYTLQPAEAGLVEQNTVLNCYLSVEREANFTISTSSHSARSLRLESLDGVANGSVQIKLDRNLGRQFQITQIIEEPFANEKGQALPLDKFSISVNAKMGESLLSGPSGLSQKPTQLYLSTGSGQADEVIANYRLDKDILRDFANATYRARFVYVVESGANVIKRLPLEVQLEILPVFEIEVSPEFTSSLLFQNISSGVTVEREIALRVNSNMQRPYAVVQKIISPLANDRGDIIPLEFFKLKSESSPEMRGNALIAQPQEVRLGDTTVFLSDAQGSSSGFILRYFLEGPPDVRSGDYFAKISYALVEK